LIRYTRSSRFGLSARTECAGTATLDLMARTGAERKAWLRSLRARYAEGWFFDPQVEGTNEGRLIFFLGENPVAAYARAGSGPFASAPEGPVRPTNPSGGHLCWDAGRQVEQIHAHREVAEAIVQPLDVRQHPHRGMVRAAWLGRLCSAGRGAILDGDPILNAVARSSPPRMAPAVGTTPAFVTLGNTRGLSAPPNGTVVSRDAKLLLSASPSGIHLSESQHTRRNRSGAGTRVGAEEFCLAQFLPHCRGRHATSRCHIV
jgi:hypothetical protein